MLWYGKLCARCAENVHALRFVIVASRTTNEQKLIPKDLDDSMKNGHRGQISCRIANAQRNAHQAIAHALATIPTTYTDYFIVIILCSRCMSVALFLLVPESDVLIYFSLHFCKK